jgi:ribosomal protein S12 methylthiotransferase
LKFEIGVPPISIVARCMVERYRGDLKKEFPEVDRFISTDELLSVGDESDTTTECLDDARRPYFVYDETMPRVLSSGSHSTYVKISEGCDRKCSFCIIPNIRGELRSRPQASIENEVKMLLAEGVKELNFIAQDLTAYGTDFEGNRGVKSALPELLSSLEQFYDPNDPYWLRLFYAYPIHTDERLMRLIQDAPYICNYLDMPLQHVSNSVLKSMRRPLGERGTRKLIDSMRKAAPEVSLRTTFIVGFPGETEDDIAQLEEFVKEGHFHHAGVFMYSQEKEADSFSLPNQVPEEVKLERRERVMLAQQQVVAKGLEKFIGTKQKVLIEGTHEDTDLLLVSRTEFQGPEEDGVTLINEIDEGLSEKFSSEDFTERARFAQVEITEVAAYDLVGTLVSL